MRIIASVLLLLSAGCERSIEVAAEEPAPGRVYVLEKAAPEGDTGWWPQVRFGPDDRPHVAFCDVAHGDVRYATRDGAAWRLEDVATAGAVGKYIAMAVDRSGRPGLTFYDQTQEILWYAHRDGGAWHLEPAVYGRELGIGGELRYDDAGSPDLFYYDPRGSLVHAHRSVVPAPPAEAETGPASAAPEGEAGQPGESGAPRARSAVAAPGWTLDVVGPAVAGFSARASAVLRPGGTWLAYAGVQGTDTAVMLATFAGPAVTITPLALERGSGWRPYLGFDGDSPFLIVWTPTNRSLALATRSATGWSTARLTTEAANYAAAQGKDGELAVVHEVWRPRDLGASGLRLLRRHDGRWRGLRIDAQPPAGDYLAVALDGRGRAIVAFHSRSHHALELYDETGGTPPPVAPGPPATGGQTPAAPPPSAAPPSSPAATQAP